MRTIEEVIADTEQAIASEIHDNRPQVASLQWLLLQMPAWRGWYLKSNQQKNYFRVTRIVPPGAEENQYRWVQKFQVWVKGGLNSEYHIETATYDFFESLWGKQEVAGMAYAIYRSPAQLNAI